MSANVPASRLTSRSASFDDYSRGDPKSRAIECSRTTHAASSSGPLSLAQRLVALRFLGLRSR